MLSAISFGVFCRSAPSTSLIMRSRKVEPGAAVMRTLIQSDSTWVPPVTAERSPPDSRITGADSPVIAASLTEAMPSITSPSDGMVSPASTRTTSPTFRLVAGDAPVVRAVGAGQQLGLRLGAGPAQRVGLRLAAAFGDRLGEIGEQHREPQPQDDLELEADVLAAGDEVADQDDGGQRGDDLEHEHHRVLDQRPRIELDEGRADRRHHDLADRTAPTPACSCGSWRFPWTWTPRLSSMRTACRRSSRDARRSGRARAPGRR